VRRIGAGLRTAAALLALAAAAGCATAPSPVEPAPFAFVDDTFSWVNELIWTYRFDAEGRLLQARRETPTEFGQRCAVMVRAVRQFFVHARFDPGAPRLERDAYDALVQRVLARDPRRKRAAPDPIAIPGYASLRAFSADHEDLLKRAVGGPWRSYVQRGNWRMIYPFLRGQQRATAETLVERVRGGELPIVHVVRYPRISINHTVLVFDTEESPEEIRFAFYDPNEARHPLELHYDRALRTFHYPRTPYFGGGPVRVYEIYDGPLR
jgi:hypothetical protein